MIKYLYALVSVLICTYLIKGTALDFISHSWHVITDITLIILSVVSVFFGFFNVIAYIEEKDKPRSDFVKFYLRTLFGMRNVPKWPVILWFIAVVYFIQINNIIVAAGFLFITVFALSIVQVQNALYNRIVVSEAKGE